MDSKLFLMNVLMVRLERVRWARLKRERGIVEVPVATRLESSFATLSRTEIGVAPSPEIEQTEDGRGGVTLRRW